MAENGDLCEAFKYLGIFFISVRNYGVCLLFLSERYFDVQSGSEDIQAQIQHTDRYIVSRLVEAKGEGIWHSRCHVFFFVLLLCTYPGSTCK